MLIFLNKYLVSLFYFSENGIGVMNLIFKNHEIPDELKVSCGF